VTTDDVGISVPRRSTVQANQAVAFARQQPVAAGALAVIVLMALAAIFAPQLAPYDPVQMDIVSMLGKPSAAHWLGTDMYGRDILSRLLYGARTALVVGIGASLLGCTAGALIGTMSAYFSGYLDLAIQRLVDIMLAIPIIIAVMVVMIVLGQAKGGVLSFNLIAAIAIPIIPNVTRVVRSAALAIRNLPYIDAARAAGYTHARIVFRHMLPNVAAPYLIMLTAYIGQAILMEAALAFLGLGITEPAPDWGLMLSGTAAGFYRTAPWMIIFPGLAISITVFAFNLLGDGLRDWLDPKFKT
jgi:peptide/nickel transport system permease protein